MRTILITGATVFLGCHLTKELLKKKGYQVIAIFGRPEDKSIPLPKADNLISKPLETLFSEDLPEIDTVVNCAFARNNDTNLLAESLDFTQRAILRFKELKCKSVINISSQGVYKRLGIGELSNEDSLIEPIDLYSMAKYSSEKMFNVSSIPNITNVRLASLYMPQRFLGFFVQKAINGEPFTVTLPNQYASLMDINDAATGLASIIDMKPEHRASVYNLGIGKQYSLLEYATSVKEIGKEFGYDVEFKVADNTSTICAGMDISRLVKDTGGHPTIFKNEMIRNIFSISNKQINERD